MSLTPLPSPHLTLEAFSTAVFAYPNTGGTSWSLNPGGEINVLPPGTRGDSKKIPVAVVDAETRTGRVSFSGGFTFTNYGYQRGIITVSYGILPLRYCSTGGGLGSVFLFLFLFLFLVFFALEPHYYENPPIRISITCETSASHRLAT